VSDVSPANALTPAVMLATAMQAQPGVYAVMLGSGVSTGAGIPTGWGIVKDLVRRVAAAAGPDDAASLEAATSDPEAWWAAHGTGELGYSSLLSALAPTKATRQGILAGYFEPTEEERNEGLKSPSKAHHALAQLVKSGSVRVIITTNFDRLTEQALEAAGVSPQVISRPEAVAGMAPLAHAPATVIKLHGDYKDLGTRNTPEELQAYPEQWTLLLKQIFDEYGLLISGWSADWDTALVAALETGVARRYPIYWDSRSCKGDTAQQVLTARGGQVIQAASADDLFGDLASSVEALTHLAEPPLTTAMAVARLKRYLPDPLHRIDLHDLVMRTTERPASIAAAQPLYDPAMTAEGAQHLHESYLTATTPLLHLAVVGVWHDPEGVHDELWLDVLQHLTTLRTLPQGTFNDRMDRLRLYPAVLFMHTVGITATRRGRDAFLIRLLTEVETTDPWQRDLRIPAANSLHYNVVLDSDLINTFPRWNNNNGWIYPASHMLKADLRDVFRDLIPNEDEYTAAAHGFEYRLGLVQHATSDAPGGVGPVYGEYVGQGQWTRSPDDETVPRSEVEFRRSGERTPDWPWPAFVGADVDLDTYLHGYRDVIKKYERWG